MRMFLAPLGIVKTLVDPIFGANFEKVRLLNRHFDPSPLQIPQSSSLIGESIIWKIWKLGFCWIG